MEDKLTYLLTCARVMRDQPTQLFSYMDVFDALYIPQPAGFWIQTFYIAGKLYVAETKHIKIEMSFLYPNGQRSEPSSVEGEANPGYLQFSGNFNSIKFTEPGRYYLKVKIDGKELEIEDRFYFDVIRL